MHPVSSLSAQRAILHEGASCSNGLSKTLVDLAKRVLRFIISIFRTIFFCFNTKEGTAPLKGKVSALDTVPAQRAPDIQSPILSDITNGDSQTKDSLPTIDRDPRTSSTSESPILDGSGDAGEKGFALGDLNEDFFQVDSDSSDEIVTGNGEVQFVVIKDTPLISSLEGTRSLLTSAKGTPSAAIYCALSVIDEVVCGRKIKNLDRILDIGIQSWEEAGSQNPDAEELFRSALDHFSEGVKGAFNAGKIKCGDHPTIHYHGTMRSGGFRTNQPLSLELLGVSSKECDYSGVILIAGDREAPQVVTIFANSIKRGKTEFFLYDPLGDKQGPSTIDTFDSYLKIDAHLKKRLNIDLEKADQYYDIQFFKILKGE